MTQVTGANLEVGVAPLLLAPPVVMVKGGAPFPSVMGAAVEASEEEEAAALAIGVLPAWESSVGFEAPDCLA